MSQDPIVDGPEPGPPERLRDGLGRSVNDETAGRPDPPPVPKAPRVPAGWRPWVIGPVVLALALFHIAPQLAHLLGPAHQVLGGLTVLPLGDTLSDAARGWLWEPLWVALGAMALRLRALQRMFRDPPSAVVMALIAAVFEGAFWVFMGLKRTGDYSPAEAAALILMLKIEGGAILGLFLLFAPLGRRKLGETDAHWNRD